MESDHEYFWSKNNGPKESKDHDRNRCADHSLAHLKDKWGVMKTYHVWTGENQFTKRYWERYDRVNMSKDLKPFVMYSMNKRRNWEIEELDSVELMGKIQNIHREEDVMLLERVAMRTADWSNNFRYHFIWDDFKIKAMHELDSYVDGKPEYRKTRVNSVRGQHPHHFLAWNRASDEYNSQLLKKKSMENIEREKRTVVVYNVMKSPNNYMEIFKKEFGRENNHSSRWAPPKYWERKRSQDLIELEMRYDDLTEDDVENNEELNTPEDEDVRPKFYNLNDHFVDEFVIVKKKKRNKIKEKKIDV